MIGRLTKPDPLTGQLTKQPDSSANRNIRLARIALAVGGLLLSFAAVLIAWDATNSEQPHPVITGDTAESP